jgi:glycosyltransferase involved in cell wall biosynthesis
MRLAWFTPWPPQQTGVAGRSAELVPRLAARGHAVDVFVDEQRVPVEPGEAAPPAPGVVRVLTAHDFVWRQARGQYDLATYQIGNSTHHQFVWPYLFRYPGLAVLHDTKLHHARGHALLSRGRIHDYRAEFAWAHPATSPDAAELGVRGNAGAFYAQWPMVRGVLATSRLVAAHSGGAVRALRAAWPECAVRYVALGEGVDESVLDDRDDARRALGLTAGDLVFGVFGALTADKRVPQILRAFAKLRRRRPDARLVLAGRPDPALALDRRIDEAGVGGATVVAGELDDLAFDRAVAAVDVVISLRWPSAGETSGPWLRALSAGRPSILTELEQVTDVPTLDPRSMQPHGPGAGPGAPPSIALSIDILDEGHSLGLAMARLAESPALRSALGRAARAWWEAGHTMSRMADDYEAAMAEAASRPAPAGDVPAHLRPDPLRAARALVADVAPERATQVETLCGSP